ncbi:hypothetical protein GCM10010329_34480 [Streptomyces spiroverticillatus]|uniref:Uncharacterized protein n=1 Tax=Streptomyces finlayi TaxID=67296 RepID=A0A919C9I3_9ACTN|nr:hypothetical protein [Streptomyces finlayi]GHA08786.1 hypothetical protein GCM10010329_34480 [Streptomyces spiroverticillatus]GHC91652.1 hypothetical protein GCM10010334_26890 [Streptomyces finlayi]
MNTQRNLLAQAALISALALAAPLATTPASATASDPAPAVQGETRTPATEVNHFFKAYRKAAQGSGPQAPEQVRKAHLTAELDARLTAWAEENHADPVMRAQNIPKDWKVRNHGQTATTATVIVTEIWGASPDTEVWYTVRRSDLKITDLTDPPLRG